MKINVTIFSFQRCAGISENDYINAHEKALWINRWDEYRLSVVSKFLKALCLGDRKTIENILAFCH